MQVNVTFSIFGYFGQMYLGRIDRLTDGSYVTTKWFVFILPVVPLGSYRVFSKKPLGNLFFERGAIYQARKVELNKEQVGKTYLIVYGILFLVFTILFYLGILDGKTNSDALGSSLIFTALGVWIMSFLLRIMKG